LDQHTAEPVNSNTSAPAPGSLGANEAIWRYLFMHMNEGCVLSEAISDETGRLCDLRYLQVNEAFERHTGVKGADVIGCRANEVFPDVEAIWPERYGQALATGQPQHFEAKIASIGRWLEVSIYRMQPGHFATIFHDISDRKRAEEALKESEAWLRAVLDNSRDCIHVLDPGTQQYLFVSPSVAETTGFTAEEIMKMGFNGVSEHIDPEDRAAVMAQQRRVAAGEDAGEPVEYRWKARNGQWRWLSTSRGLVRDRQGRSAALVGVTRDITEQRLVEEKLRENKVQRSLANQIMVVEERERRRLAVDMHDGLGQILSLARMKLGAMAQQPQREARKQQFCELAGLIDKALHQARTLTFELSPPVLHELGLGPACEWLAEEMAQRYGLKVNVQCQGPIGALQEQIAIVVFRAVRELVINVAKHARVGQVRVRLWQQEGTLQVEVKDNGAGFDLNNADEGRSGKPGGGGFGLFSIRERLQHVSGVMDIRSQPGRGTTVILTVPCAVPRTDSNCSNSDGPDFSGGQI